MTAPAETICRLETTTERLYCWARVEYDGTDFLGFQVQAEGRTVQGEIERALEQVTQTPTRVLGAGRTDTGVHALGQVVAFYARWSHPLSDLHRALNAVLPADVSLPALGWAAEGFHPRFSALGRAYRYTVWNGAWRSPLAARYAHHVAEPLDLAAMQEATRLLVGSHDFAAFGRPPQGENSRRRVVRAGWSRQESEIPAGGQLFYFDIEADAFLYRMVRSLVGTLVWVGVGRLSPQDLEAILASADRDRAAPLAPACGLCLMRVIYPEGVLR